MKLSRITNSDDLGQYYEFYNLREVNDKIQHPREAMKVKHSGDYPRLAFQANLKPEEELKELEITVTRCFWPMLINKTRIGPNNGAACPG